MKIPGLDVSEIRILRIAYTTIGLHQDTANKGYSIDNHGQLIMSQFSGLSNFLYMWYKGRHEKKFIIILSMINICNILVNLLLQNENEIQNDSNNDVDEDHWYADMVRSSDDEVGS